MKFLPVLAESYNLKGAREAAKDIGKPLRALTTITPLDSMEPQDREGYVFFQTLLKTIIDKNSALTNAINSFNIPAMKRARAELQAILRDIDPVHMMVSGDNSYIGAVAFLELMEVYQRTSISKTFDIQFEASTATKIVSLYDDIKAKVVAYSESLSPKRQEGIDSTISQCCQIISAQKAAKAAADASSSWSGSILNWGKPKTTAPVATETLADNVKINADIPDIKVSSP